MKAAKYSMQETPLLALTRGVDAIFRQFEENKSIILSQAVQEESIHTSLTDTHTLSNYSPKDSKKRDEAATLIRVFVSI